MTTKQTGSSAKIIGRIAIIIVLAGLIGGIYPYLRSRTTVTAITTNRGSLQTTQATVGDLVLFANGTGTIAPSAESSFGFNATGQVSEIDVQIGDRAEAGQVLAQLDDTFAKIKLDQAQQAMNKLTSPAAIATAQQELATAQTNVATTKQALEHLISPEVLFWEERIAEREQTLASAKAANQTDTSDAAIQKVTNAETSLKYAQDSLAHFQRVYMMDYIPATFTEYRSVSRRGTTIQIPIQIEDPDTGKMVDLINPPSDGQIGMARADYAAAKASVTEAQTYFDVLNGGDIPDGATGANLVTYIQTKHALETAEYNLNATKLIAPISGTVTALNINVGDQASSGSAVITISNLDQPYVVNGYLVAEDWGQVQVGYEVEVTFDILPDQVFKGTVTDVDPILDTSSSNSALVHFKARLNDSITYKLPAGSAASVNVIGGRAKSAVLVPVEALHEYTDGKYALFVMQNGKLSLRLVDVGLKDLTKAVITSGLKAGEVVTTGVVKTK